MGVAAANFCVVDRIGRRGAHANRIRRSGSLNNLISAFVRQIALFCVLGIVLVAAPEVHAAMAAKARSVPHLKLLKLKLGGAGDLERMMAVRQVRPALRSRHSATDLLTSFHSTGNIRLDPPGIDVNAEDMFG